MVVVLVVVAITVALVVVIVTFLDANFLYNPPHYFLPMMLA